MARRSIGRSTGAAWGVYYGDPYDPDSFGMRLVALREEKGWSRGELAKRAGVNYTTLYEHEPGEYWRKIGKRSRRYPAPLRDTIWRLMDALSVTVGALTPAKAPPLPSA